MVKCLKRHVGATLSRVQTHMKSIVGASVGSAGSHTISNTLLSSAWDSAMSLGRFCKDRRVRRDN